VAKPTAVLLASVLVATGCDGRRYGTNERVLGSVSVEKAFQTLNTGTVLRSKGHRQAGGRVPWVKNTCDIWHMKNFPDPGADTLGAKAFFSIEGSSGVMILRYTSVKADDAVGYLSCEIVEFRK
jgi:hypothetical protein